MPDKNRATISATQSPALFNASPYITRWMLYRFLKGDDIEQPASDRMDWGIKLQPLVLEQAARDLKLEVTPNEQSVYVAHPGLRLGYTADAAIVCPDRGRGTVESKCVFDYGVWMRDWNGGKTPPHHYELQLQHQLLVGDGHARFDWGVIAAWVCGEMHYFERRRDEIASNAIVAASSQMFDDVANNREPSPFGAEIEAPLLTALFPVAGDKVLDLTAHADAHKWADLARMFADFGQQANFYDKARAAAKLQLQALMTDSVKLLLPGVTVRRLERRVKEHTRPASVSVQLKIDTEATAADGDVKTILEAG